MLLTRRFPYCRAVVGAHPPGGQQQARAMISSSSSFDSPSEMPYPSISQSDADYDYKTKEFLRLMNRSRTESPYALGKHRSNALELVHKIPIVEVDGDMAVCDGGGGALGHPLEYISLAKPGSVEYCKYCALRYTKKAGSKGGHH